MRVAKSSRTSIKGGRAAASRPRERAGGLQVGGVVEYEQPCVRGAIAMLEAQHRDVRLALDEPLAELADRQPQRDAHEDPVRRAVPDGEDGALLRGVRAMPLDVGLEQAVEERPDACCDVVPGLA